MTMDDTKSLLVAFSGASTSHAALDYGVWLAGQLEVPVSLLGIVEKPNMRGLVEGLAERATVQLESAGIGVCSQIVGGNCRKMIIQHARENQHLAVFGPFNRPVLRRWLRGRSFRRIFEQVSTPVLYTRATHPALRKILVCMGGLGYAHSAERWALWLAKRLGAAVTLLHVVEPIAYQYPTAQEIQDHWENILETQTPQAEHLRRGLAEAELMGVPVNFEVRHGDIVHEILAEVTAQAYDLVVMGSAKSSGNLRHLFMPNVTAEVAEHVECPILAAAFGQEWIFE